MKKWILLMPIFVSTQTYWAIFGPIDASTDVAISTPTLTNVHLKASTGDCYILRVNPNGSLYTDWEPCPQ